MEGGGHAPGGLGGACVSESVGAEVPPNSSCEWTMNSRVFSSADGGHSRASELPTHTRPPNPPAHGDRRPQRYNSAHSDLEVFITPGFWGRVWMRVFCARVPSNWNHELATLSSIFPDEDGGATKRKQVSEHTRPPTPPDPAATFFQNRSHDIARKTPVPKLRNAPSSRKSLAAGAQVAVKYVEYEDDALPELIGIWPGRLGKCEVPSHRQTGEVCHVFFHRHRE